MRHPFHCIWALWYERSPWCCGSGFPRDVWKRLPFLQLFRCVLICYLGWTPDNCGDATDSPCVTKIYSRGSTCAFVAFAWELLRLLRRMNHAVSPGVDAAAANKDIKMTQCTCWVSDWSSAVCLWRSVGTQEESGGERVHIWAPSSTTSTISFLYSCSDTALVLVRLLDWPLGGKEKRSKGNKAKPVFPLESVFILVIASTSGMALKSFQTICFITYFCFQCINICFF